MLTSTEMRLKSRTQATYVDSTSSSPMVLLANSNASSRRSTPSTENVHKSCFNFNKGSCRFGEYCKFLHNGVHGNSSLLSSHGSTATATVPSSSNLTHNEIITLQGLLAKLGTNGNTTVQNNIEPNIPVQIN
ncbi:ribonuclease H-like domain-containing protein [Tanacetum coccineum]